MLLCISVAYLFLLLNSTVFYCINCITILQCLSIALLIDSWIVSGFWLVWIKLLGIFLFKFFVGMFLISLV